MRPAFGAVLGALFLAMILHVWPAQAQTGPQPRLRTTPLTITTASGTHTFTVEMAETPDQMARGLMFRTTMAPDEGMLFNFRRDEIVTMWMQNTILPLDMVFITRDGRVATVAERTTPYSTDVVSSRVPVRAVLELNAGTAARIGLKPGDQLRNALFGNAP
jgi:uncharacterized membrane protein (UPF0127 family)